MKKNKGLQAVTHPSTDQAQCCLTSVIKGLVALDVCNTLGALAATFRTKTPGSDSRTKYPVLQA